MTLKPLLTGLVNTFIVFSATESELFTPFKVYVTFAVPDVIPVTNPDEFTEKTAGFELDQTPPTIEAVI